MKLRCYSLLRLALLFAFLLNACSNLAPTPTAVPQPTPSPTAMPYWPTQDWRTSTPEQQGMDSELLAQMSGQPGRYLFHHKKHRLGTGGHRYSARFY